MRLLKQAMTVLGAAMIVAMLVAVIAPKKVHAVVATLVQIVPGATTHLGQNESQLVNLACGTGACELVDASGALSGSAYAVPTGYTLIVTDYEWATTSAVPGTVQEDWLINYNVVPVVTEFNLSNSTTIADKTGRACGHEHYTAGFRVASGTTLADSDGIDGLGSSFVKGYLVPND
jgi:hypothetical protein